ncbi:MAG: tetratricopeptide repeat protein, partial [Chloroflexota bacterium]
MDSQPQHNDLPTAQDRVPQTGPLSIQEPKEQLTEPQPIGSTPQRVRPNISNSLIILGVALLSISLLAFATWTYISHQNDTVGPLNTSPSGQADLPRDTIALINSSTPISLTLLPNIESSAGNLSLPPISDSWTPALSEAHRAEIEGRYSSAISQYSALVGADAPGEAREALWGLASSYAVSGQRELAIRAYSIFAGLSDPRAAAAFVRAGALHEELGDISDAVRIYGEYAKQGGPAANAVKLMQARLLGSTPEAETLYNEVIDSNPLDPDLRQALASLADLKSKRGDHAGARLLYERLATLQTQNPRPDLDSQGSAPQVLAAGEAEAAGDKSGAVKSLLAYISRPGSYSDGRYAALTALLKLEPTAVTGGTVAPMIAAQVAFDAGYYGEAITYMDSIRTATPNSPDRPAAALLTGRAFALLGDAASAYNWYTATLQTYPTSPEAPGAIRRAADSLAEQSQWDASLGTYKQAVAVYPNAGDESVLARIHGSVLAYRLEDSDTALSMITPLLSAEISPTLKSRALFWAAKIQKSTSNSAWRDTIKPVSMLSPGSYFDFRARSLLSGEPDSGPTIPPFTSTQTATTLSVSTVDYTSEAPEREALVSWASSLTSSLTILTMTSTPMVTTPTPSTTSTPGSTVTPNSDPSP